MQYKSENRNAKRHSTYDLLFPRWVLFAVSIICILVMVVCKSSVSFTDIMARNCTLDKAAFRDIIFAISSGLLPSFGFAYYVDYITKKNLKLQNENIKKILMSQYRLAANAILRQIKQGEDFGSKFLVTYCYQGLIWFQTKRVVPLANECENILKNHSYILTSDEVAAFSSIIRMSQEFEFISYPSWKEEARRYDQEIQNYYHVEAYNRTHLEEKLQPEELCETALLVKTKSEKLVDNLRKAILEANNCMPYLHEAITR